MSEEKVFKVGGVELHAENRSLGADGGPSVRVFAEVENKPVQLLRFDCFRKDPHYHYDPSGKNQMYHLDQTTTPDTVGWTISQLGSRLQAMIRRAGYDAVAEKVDQGAVKAVLPQVEAVMRG